MTFPTVTVDVSFSTGPLDTPVWEAVTGDVRAISTSTGRNAQFAAYEPGTGTITLNNRHRNYDPLYADGPHFGELKANRRVRVQAAYDGTTYDVLTAFVNGWPQSYAPPSESVSTVGVTDGFKLLAKMRMPDDLYADEVLADSPRLWYRLGETSGSQLLDSSGNNRHALGQIDIKNVAADGLLPCSTDGGVNLDSAQWDARIPKEHLAFDYDPCSIEFWFRADKPPSGGWVGLICSSVEAGLYPEIFISHEDPAFPGSGGYIQFAAMDTLFPTRTVYGSSICDGLPHHVVCTRSGSTLRVYVDGINVSAFATSFGAATSTVGAPLDLNVNYFTGTYEKWEGAQGPSLDEFAIYDTALSQARIQAHYQAGALLWDGDRTGARLGNVLDAGGWPAADRNIDTGQPILGPATWEDGTKVLELAQLIEATEQGTLFIDHRDGGKLRFRGRHAVLAETASTVSQATFTDEATDDTNVHYSGLELDYDETEIYNHVTVGWVGGSVTVLDQASIDENGEQSITVDTLLTTRDQAEGIAAWILLKLATPQLRLRSITINATGRRPGSAQEAATWEQVLGRKFGDRITVIRHPQGVGDPIETDVIIDGIDHEIGPGVNSWRTTFRCSPAETVAYWVAGVSLAGIDTRAAA